MTSFILTYFSSSLLIFLFGASFGSFFQLLVDRIPIGQDVVFTKSYCPNCWHQIESQYLIPVFGFLSQRGKCWFCLQQICSTSLIVELSGGLISLLMWHFSFLYRSINYWLVFWLFLCALFDQQYHYIYQDMITLVAIGVLILQFPLSGYQLLVAICIGSVLILLSFSLKQSIGSADIQWLIIIAVTTTLNSFLKMLLLSNILIISCHLKNIWPQKKVARELEIPMLPYLLIAYLLLPFLK